MFAPNQATYMAADARHAELQANAARARFAASVLRPKAAKAHIVVHRHRVATAVATVVMALALATGVAATVSAPQAAAPAADATAGGGAAGGATYIR